MIFTEMFAPIIQGKLHFPCAGLTSQPFVDLPSGDTLLRELPPSDKFAKIMALSILFLVEGVLSSQREIAICMNTVGWRIDNMNQKDRMLHGLPYKAWLDGLEEERELCKERVWELNMLDPKDRNRIPEILKKLFGKTGENVWVEPPFHCDYGWNSVVITPPFCGVWGRKKTAGFFTGSRCVDGLFSTFSFNGWDDKREICLLI